jgi:DNA phosphorothioation-dependent restriction protein DptG
MAKLNDKEKAIRKIAWGRFAFLKKFIDTDLYSLKQKIKYINKFYPMYEASTLDAAGKKMAIKKLDALKIKIESE